MSRAKWSVATARQHLPRVIKSAAREPQAIYRRNRLVAAVVSPTVAAAGVPQGSPPVLKAALAELRSICEEEGYQLPTTTRRDRKATSHK